MFPKLERSARRIYTRLLGDEKGSVLEGAALGMGVILAMAALVIDLGVLYLTRAQLSRAADAAVFAGVQELPDQPDVARSMAISFASHNGVPEDGVSIDISGDNHEIRVEVHETVSLLFARLLGFSQMDVRARSAARVASVRALTGAVPIGVVQQDFEYGRLYALKYGPGGPQGQHHGNFGALALGGQGGRTYEDNLRDGYNGVLRIGDVVKTKRGNMAGPTRHGVEDRIGRCWHIPKCTPDHFVPGCPRLVYVPVVDTLDVDGRKEGPTIVGFAAFFLEGAEDEDSGGAEVGGQGQGHGKGKSMSICGNGDQGGNSGWIYGTFIRMVTEGELGAGGDPDFGLRTYKLIE